MKGGLCMEMIYSLATLLGVIGGASGFYTLYTAKAKKESITIGNFERIIGELRKEVDILSAKVHDMELDQNMYKKAISFGYKCKMCAKDAVCPIILSLEEDGDKVRKRNKK